MPGWAETLRSATISGVVASATSTAALALLAREEGRGAFQPLNSTSHWLHGRRAARVKDADAAHTLVGYATHYAATVFWALLFERWAGARRPVSTPGLVSKAVAVSALAAVVDYTVTPGRFTPGWEYVLSKRSMALGYVAMAAGLVLGAQAGRPGAAKRTVEELSARTHANE